MKAFMEQTTNLTKWILSEEEWSQFVNSVDSLTSDLKELIASKPCRHTTSNWKKRQRRRPSLARLLLSFLCVVGIR